MKEDVLSFLHDCMPMSYSFSVFCFYVCVRVAINAKDNASSLHYQAKIAALIFRAFFVVF